jgi:hypothetical protein
MERRNKILGVFDTAVDEQDILIGSAVSCDMNVAMISNHWKGASNGNM